VTQLNDLDNPELKKIFRKHLIRGIIFLFILVALVSALALSFEPQIREFADWLTNNFGFWGLSASVFVADLIISPIPPDAALFFIGQSSMHEQWIVWVPLLGLVSTVAGLCGWFVGRRLQRVRFFKRLIASFRREHRTSIKRFGFWMVVIGALTPLPFSLTCWVAGIFKLPLQTFMLAALARVPRFVVYYWAIFYSSEVGSFFTQFF
jgi:membrane protein YqaA with SNARE-associated domain